jgi:MGT family glycosyltransferase
VFFSLFDRRFNSIRTSLGLSPVSRSAVNSALSPYLILCPTCDGFEYPRTDWPPQTHLIGPAPWGKADTAGNGFSWIRELPRDRPLIYVTLGTVQVFRSLEFFSIVIEALKEEHCQVVLSVGRSVDPDSFKGSPAHFRFEQFVPHDLILPRADAVIHHGGQGIAQDCIYHGLGSVVVPISQDLFEVARRCDVAGVSVRIPYRKLTAARLKKAVDRALHDPEIRKKTDRLQALFRKTDAARTGAGLIERLIQTGEPVCRTSPTETR